MNYNKRVLSAIDRDLRDQYRSKRYSKSLSATNSVFAPNYLFSKPSPRRIYNPNAQFFKHGGPHGGPGDPPLTYAQKLAAYKDSLAAYNWAKDLYYGDYDEEVARQLEDYDPKSKTNYGDWFDTDNDGKIDKYIDGLTFEEYADEHRGGDAGKIFAMAEKFNVKPFIFTTTDSFPLEPMYVKPTYPTKPTMKEAYKSVDKEKYPTFEDFEFAAEFYKKHGKNPDPSDFPSNRLSPPPPPEYEVEDIEPEIEIEKLDIIQPEFLSNDAELPELEEREEVEGVDYKIKRGPYIQPGSGFLELQKGLVGTAGRTGKRLRYKGPRLKWGFRRIPIENEFEYPEGFVPRFQYGGPHDPPEVKQRRGVRENPDGTVSSHLMRTEYIPERGWVGFPSLFQDSKPYADDQQNWVDMSEEEDWMKVYKEAERRGEVYDFGEDKEAALAFGEGSWKNQLPEREREEELYNMERARELGYERDDSGHLPSVDEETGMWLKSMDHPTSWKEYMYGQLNKDIGTNSRVVVNPEGHFGDKQLQYIEAELDSDEIQKYVDGGYIVEDLPKAQLGKIVKTIKSFTKPKLPYPKIDLNKLGSYPISKDVLPTTVKGTKEYLKNFKSKKRLLLESSDMKFDRVLKDITLQDTPTLVRNFNAAELDKDLLGLKNENRILGDKGEIYGRRTKHFSGTGAGAHIGGMGAGYDTVFIGNIDDIKKASGSHLREISPTDTYFYNSDNVFKLTDKGVYITSDMDTYMRLLNAGKPVKYEVNLMDGSHSNLSKYIGDDANILKSFDSYITNPSNRGSLMPTTYPNKTTAFPSSMNSSAAHSHDILADLETLERLPLFNQFIKQNILGNTKLSSYMTEAKELGTGEFDTDYSYFTQWINLPKQVREAELQKIKNFYESNVKTGKLSESAFGKRYENNLEQYQIDYKKIIDQLEDLHKNAGEGLKYKKGGMLPKAQGGGGIKKIKSGVKKLKDVVKVNPNAAADLAKKLSTSTKANLQKPSAKDIANDVFMELVLGPLEGYGKLVEGLLKLQTPKIGIGLTKPSIKKLEEAQDFKKTDAINFVKDWYYKPDGVIRPEPAKKIRDFFKGNLSPQQFHNRKSFKTRLDEGEMDRWGVDMTIDGEQVIKDPDLLESMLTLDQSARYLDHPYNPFSLIKDLYVGSTSKEILEHPLLNDHQKQYLLKKRGAIRGVNFTGPDTPSVTLRNTGRFYLDPETMAEVAVHEAGHSSQGLSDWINQIQEWDPKKSSYYTARDTGYGKLFKDVLWPSITESVLPNPFHKTTDYLGSPNELHSELMRARFKVSNKMAEDAMKKDGFTSDKFDDFQLQGIRRDYRIKAIEDLHNPSDSQIKELIRSGNLGKHFRVGAKKADKYNVIRLLPGLAASFALPSLTDDSKPKLQYGGALELGDEVTEDMVEELRRQGYTLEEI